MDADDRTPWDIEINQLRICFDALEKVDPDTARRMIGYLNQRFVIDRKEAPSPLPTGE